MCVYVCFKTQKAVGASSYVSVTAGVPFHIKPYQHTNFRGHISGGVHRGSSFMNCYRQVYVLLALKVKKVVTRFPAGPCRNEGSSACKQA
jgi:hypothetical protein